MHKLIMPLFILLFTLMFSSIIGAQATLTVNLPDFVRGSLPEDAFADFEAANGVTVTFVAPRAGAFYTPPAVDLDQHLSDVAAYASSADVVYVSDFNLSVEATRAGVYLDFAPLTAVGGATTRPAWGWDGGLWALPYSERTPQVIYNHATFDAAGLAYPDASWTLDDYALAARSLTTPETPGLYVDDLALLFRTLTGRGFYDATTQPNPPQFAFPELTALLEAWAALENEGAASSDPGAVNLNAVPLRIGFPTPDDTTAPLPGGVTRFNTDALAVSGGTASPALAYALAVELADLLAAPTNTDGDTLGLPELRYGDYVESALTAMLAQGIDAATALQQAETTAAANLDAAAAAEITVVVAPVDSSAAPASDGLTLRFGLGTTITPLPNANLWDDFIADFVAADPTVSAVEWETIGAPPEADTSFDCFTLPRAARYTPSPAVVLPVSPLLATDPGFDPADLVPGALDAVSSAGEVYGVPLYLEPVALWADAAAFEANGYSFPAAGWATSAFTEVVSTYPDQRVIKPYDAGLTHILLLAAAYGGLPIDYSTRPATVDLTAPDNVAALVQIVALVQRERMDYYPLYTLSLVGARQRGGGNEPPLVVDTVGPGSLRFNVRGDYLPVTFPTDGSISAVSYQLSAGYISAATPAPQACYRLLRAITGDPTVIAGMPAERALLDDPAFLDAQGRDLEAYYRAFAAKLDAGPVVNIPRFADDVTFFAELWLGRALDRAILEGRPLEAELTQAQSLINTYYDCLPPIDATTEGDPALECALAVDPTLGDLFGGA